MAVRRRKRRKIEITLNGRNARIAGVVFGLGLIAATIGCVLFAGGGADFPERSKPEPLASLDRIEGWVPYWADEAAVATEAADAGFTDLLFFHGSVLADGSVELEDEAGLAAGLAVARRRGVRSWLTVTNHGGTLDGALDESRLAEHAEALIELHRRSGCDHLDLDYEGLAYHQAFALGRLVTLVKPGLPVGAELALTLQPVDSALRKAQRGLFREFLESGDIFTVRVMMYDYHWRNSLPGALYPMPAFQRLVDEWGGHAHRLTLCLPLYGYDWPRPEDVSIPRADVVTMRDVRGLAAKPGFQAAWMRREGELAVRYRENGVARMAAVPSFKAIQERVDFMLERGVPAVSFWHLGAAELAPVVEACDPDADIGEPIPHGELQGWDTWMIPFKERNCRVMFCDRPDTLAAIGERHGVARSVMNRFNEHVTGGDCRGHTVYIPVGG